MDYVNRDVDNGVELAFHQGDIAYADGDPRVWDTFMDGIEPYASRVPYMVRPCAAYSAVPLKHLTGAAVGECKANHLLPLVVLQHS